MKVLLHRAANPDHAARLILMSCYLYYKCSSPVLSDGEFDNVCQYVAEHWSELTPLRQHQLKSPEDIKGSGHHVLMSVFALEGAITWHLKEKKHLPEDRSDLDWEFNEEYKLRLGTLK